MGIRTIILSLIFMCYLNSGTCQKAINLLAMPMGDSIILRWSPLDVDIWEKGLKSGYQIKRSGPFNPENEIISFSDSWKILEDTVKVWSENKWLEDHDAGDEWEMIAAGMIYGDLGLEWDQPTMDPEILEDRRIARENRFALSFHAANHSVQAAKKLGLLYVDRDVLPGQAYLYAVSQLSSGLEKNNKDYYLVEENVLPSLPQPVIFDAEWGDKEVSIAWDHYALQESFVSYNLERSGDGGLTWQQRNFAPIVPGVDLKDAVLTACIDSLEDNLTLYQYRIIGHSPFGINSVPSETIEGRGKPGIQEIAITLHPLIENVLNHIEISWTINHGEYIKGYNVYRSPDYNGPYTRINDSTLSPSAQLYRDEDFEGTGFYFIEAIAIDGSTHTSLKRMINKMDITPPARPQNLTCVVDTVNGGILLNWDKPGAPDFAGYRIFASLRAEEGYQDIAESLIPKPVFNWPIDVKRNGESIFFKVQAQDNRYNRSAYSDSCEVRLLDVRPPEPPLIRKIVDTQNKVVLEWAGSPSYDVDHYELWRGEDEKTWKKAARIDDKQRINLFSDTTGLVAGVTYWYKILSVDKSGNTSMSNIKKAKVWKSKIAPPVAEFMVLRDEKTQGNILSWQYLNPDLIREIEIYRSHQKSNPSRYMVISGHKLRQAYRTMSLNSGQYRWQDPQVQLQMEYEYSIRILLKNGDITPRTPWQKSNASK